jgi:hypothetical protein
MAQDRAQLLITAVDQTKSAFDAVRGHLARLGEASLRVRGLLAGLGATLTVAGFAALIKGALDTADQINKLSQKIGISVEALSTLRFAAQLSDVDLDTLQKSIKGLSQAITEANTGIGEGARVFAALGISVKNADGSLKSTDQVLLNVADVFARLEDGAVKTALAVKLFGKSGLDLIPFLNQGASGITRLTAEAQQLGLKLTTDTARSAEAFNDNLVALKASAAALGIALTRDMLPELTTITTVMRQAADESGTLMAVWVGLGGLGNLVFNGTEIKQARDEIKALNTAVTDMREQLATGQESIPFTPFTVEFDDAARATLQKSLAQAEQALSAAQARLTALTTRPDTATPTGKPTEEMQRIACTVAGGAWVNGQCLGKDVSGARLTLIKAQAQGEFNILKEGLTVQQAALDRALEDRLLSLTDYYAAKTALDRAALDHDIAAKQQERAAQSDLASTAVEEAPRARALAEVKKLESEITVLAIKRTEVGLANAQAQVKAEKELLDQLAQVRERLAEHRGGDADITRTQLERTYQPLIEKLQRLGNNQGAADVVRLINVEADLAALSTLERQFQAVTDRMTVRERELHVQKDAGALTETQRQRAVLTLHHQTAEEVENLIPKMQALAAATGSEEAINRVARLKGEVAGLKTEVDALATRLNGDVEAGLATLFEQIGSGAKNAKEAFNDFARSVLAAINKIAAQKLAESLFAGMNGGGAGGGIGGLIASAFAGGGYAQGGYVTGPGSATSDSIPARLSAGEFVLRAAAVRRIGVDVLHALNGGAFAPRWVGTRLAFAQGGLVPAAPPPAAPSSQSVRIVNVVDPALTADYLNSPQGEKVVLNVLSRNAGALKHLLTGA